MVFIIVQYNKVLSSIHRKNLVESHFYLLHYPTICCFALLLYTLESGKLDGALTILWTKFYVWGHGWLWPTWRTGYLLPWINWYEKFSCRQPGILDNFKKPKTECCPLWYWLLSSDIFLRTNISDHPALIQNHTKN